VEKGHEIVNNMLQKSFSLEGGSEVDKIRGMETLWKEHEFIVIQ
jgi:hypothetical protein